MPAPLDAPQHTVRDRPAAVDGGPGQPAAEIGERILVRVAPEAIACACQHRSLRARAARVADSLFVCRWLRRGDWDRRTFAFQDHETARLVAAVIERDWNPEACLEPLIAYYRWRGQPEPEDRARRKLADYLARYRALAEDLLANGYQAGRARDEIGVALARDGRLVKVSGGNHRLALAQQLGLAEIVVQIRFAHAGRYPVRTWLRAGEARARIRADAAALGQLAENR